VEGGVSSLLNQLKISNIKNILLCLLACKRATKQVLGQKTGLSNTTVSDSINSMLKLGLVVADGNEDSIGGRRSAIYTINCRYGQFIGIELRTNQLIYTICDLLGNILTSRILDLDSINGEMPIQLLYRAIEEARETSNAVNLLAIGIGISGAIDYGNQVVLESHELEWRSVHLKEIVERRFYIPTFIDSAVNGQIFLEQYVGQQFCPASFLVLHENFPLKAAICIDGNILRGARNLCGTVENFNTAVANALHLADVWDVSQLIIRYQAPQYGSQTQTVLGNQRVITKKLLNKEDLAQGMALLAEAQWFGSIYFLLQ